MGFKPGSRYDDQPFTEGTIAPAHGRAQALGRNREIKISMGVPRGAWAKGVFTHSQTLAFRAWVNLGEAFHCPETYLSNLLPQMWGVHMEAT